MPYQATDAFFYGRPTSSGTGVDALSQDPFCGPSYGYCFYSTASTPAVPAPVPAHWTDHFYESPVPTAAESDPAAPAPTGSAETPIVGSFAIPSTVVAPAPTGSAETPIVGSFAIPSTVVAPAPASTPSPTYTPPPADWQPSAAAPAGAHPGGAPTSGSGIDWVAAGSGAAIGAALALLLTGGTAILRRKHKTFPA